MTFLSVKFISLASGGRHSTEVAFVLLTQQSQVPTLALCSVRDAAQTLRAIIEPENIISVVPRSLTGDLKGKIKLLLTLRKMIAPKFSLLSVLD